MGAPQPRQSIEEAIDRIYSIAFQAGEIPSIPLVEVRL